MFNKLFLNLKLYNMKSIKLFLVVTLLGVSLGCTPTISDSLAQENSGINPLILSEVGSEIDLPMYFTVPFALNTEIEIKGKTVNSAQATNEEILSYLKEWVVGLYTYETKNDIVVNIARVRKIRANRTYRSLNVDLRVRSEQIRIGDTFYEFLVGFGTEVIADFTAFDDATTLEDFASLGFAASENRASGTMVHYGYGLFGNEIEKVIPSSSSSISATSATESAKMTTKIRNLIENENTKLGLYVLAVKPVHGETIWRTRENIKNALGGIEFISENSKEEVTNDSLNSSTEQKNNSKK